MEDSADKPQRSRKIVFKRITLWIFGVLIMLFAGRELHTQMTRYRQFTHDLAQYQGIRIGAPKIEVEYVLGHPKYVLAPPSPDDTPQPPQGFLIQYEVDATSGPTAMPAGKTSVEFNSWSWDESGHRVDVDFDPKTHNVTTVSCYVNEPEHAVVDCSTIGGVSTGNTEAEMIARIGQPDRSEFNELGASKTVYYGDLGFEIYLRKQRIYMIRKLTPGKIGLWWWLEHWKL